MSCRVAVCYRLKVGQKNDHRCMVKKTTFIHAHAAAIEGLIQAGIGWQDLGADSEAHFLSLPVSSTAGNLGVPRKLIECCAASGVALTTDWINIHWFEIVTMVITIRRATAIHARVFSWLCEQTSLNHRVDQAKSFSRRIQNKPAISARQAIQRVNWAIRYIGFSATLTNARLSTNRDMFLDRYVFPFSPIRDRVPIHTKRQTYLPNRHALRGHFRSSDQFLEVPTHDLCPFLIRSGAFLFGLVTTITYKTPIHVRTESLASNTSDLFNIRTEFGRRSEIAVYPVPNTRTRYRLPGFTVAQLGGQPSHSISFFDGCSECVNRCFVIHALNITLVEASRNPCSRHLF